MRVILAALAGASLIVTSGCSTIRNELRYPGGAPGKLLDERTFDSSGSKQLALLRATLALAIAARMGEGSVSVADADVFARQLAEAANEINYAAVDAGFPAPPISIDGEEIDRATCRLTKDEDEFVTADFATEDAKCAGYYVNFEANIARIESRIIRAMLTSLPTDRARKFLEEISKGDILSATWSLARTAGDLAGAFHRGSGAYRAGLENVAAQARECAYSAEFTGENYDQATATVYSASACLGLSHKSLFINDDIGPNKLPDNVDPKAFMALFRIARTACVALPMASTPSQPERGYTDRKARAEACALIAFAPNPRTDKIVVEAPGDGAGSPDDAEAGATEASGTENADDVLVKEAPALPATPL